MLDDFIAAHRGEIIARCKAKVALRATAPATEPDGVHGIPVFLDQLTDALRCGLVSTPHVGTSAVRHGHDLLLQGFTVSQVVHDYGDVCQSITELAIELKAPISTEEFQTLNRCLDDAIAGAVTEYGRQKTQTGIDGESARSHERLGFFAHEMRNLIQTALTAFEVLKSGQVGVAGTTGAVLHRSLVASRTLISRSLAEVRLTRGIDRPEHFLLAGFIAEVAAAASLEASGRGIGLAVSPVDDDVSIAADRQVLAAVVGNLLQNAFKFTRPKTTVTLRVVAEAERVRIEIQDECGGFQGGDVDGLFLPFEQRSVDRSGLGLGLAFSRWGVEANHGRIHAINLPGMGCMFTIDLPRLPVTSTAMA